MLLFFLKKMHLVSVFIQFFGNIFLKKLQHSVFHLCDYRNNIMTGIMTFLLSVFLVLPENLLSSNPEIKFKIQAEMQL